MYELNFIRRRKAKLIAAIIGGVGTIGVSTLSIAAFLGRSVGSFTISLEAQNVQLSLSEKSDFKTRTSFLRLDDVGTFQEYEYWKIKNLSEQIDSEETDYSIGQNPGDEPTLNFLKYTFFVKNIGSRPARYDLAIKINEIHASKAGQDFEDTLRVMFFDNGESEVFAKKSSTPHRNENGEYDYSAPIALDEAHANYYNVEFEGYATSFLSDEEIAVKEGEKIDIDEVRRYTIVTWLEGERSGGYADSLQGATIKLGVEINAYENK